MPDRPSQWRNIHIESREVPPPKSISLQAQAYLSAGAEPRPNIPLPALNDRTGWKALAAQGDAYLSDIYRRTPGLDKIPGETLTLGGVTTYVARPSGADADKIILNIHGGALTMGGGETCRLQGSLLALAINAPVYSIDYRMPPDHPYPAALNDCIAVYRVLLDRYPPGQIVVFGGSAGGNLVAAMALRARDEALPAPAGLVLLTPEVDLTESGDSFQVNRQVDVMLPVGLPQHNALYANGHDLLHPYLSPLFGDFSLGFPRTFLQAGTRDLFLSNAVRMHRALRKAGVEVELHIFEGMPHGGFMGTQEDQEMHEEIRRFVLDCWK